MKGEQEDRHKEREAGKKGVLPAGRLKNKDRRRVVRKTGCSRMSLRCSCIASLERPVWKLLFGELGVHESNEENVDLNFLAKD